MGSNPFLDDVSAAPPDGVVTGDLPEQKYPAANPGALRNPIHASANEPLPPKRSMNTLLGRPTTFVFLFGLLVRLALMHAHPAIFRGDTALRLANRDRILLAYQLPLLLFAIAVRDPCHAPRGAGASSAGARSAHGPR